MFVPSWMPRIEGLAFVLLVVALHLGLPKLKSVGRVTRAVSVSLSGGVSVAYVFVAIFPDLNEHQHLIYSALPHSLRFFDRHAFVVALIGMLTYYALTGIDTGTTRGERASYLAHLYAFAIYNLLIGAIAASTERHGVGAFATYTFAMLLHMLVVDANLRAEHPKQYDEKFRFILSACLIAGLFAGTAATIPPFVLSLLFSFVAGGVILNTLRNELPSQGENSLPAFAFGALAYSAVLIFT